MEAAQRVQRKEEELHTNSAGLQRLLSELEKKDNDDENLGQVLQDKESRLLQMDERIKALENEKNNLHSRSDVQRSILIWVRPILNKSFCTELIASAS